MASTSQASRMWRSVKIEPIQINTAGSPPLLLVSSFPHRPQQSSSHHQNCRRCITSIQFLSPSLSKQPQRPIWALPEFNPSQELSSRRCLPSSVRRWALFSRGLQSVLVGRGGGRPRATRAMARGSAQIFHVYYLFFRIYFHVFFKLWVCWRLYLKLGPGFDSMLVPPLWSASNVEVVYQ